MIRLGQASDAAAGAAQVERRVVDGAWFGYVEGEIFPLVLLSVGGVSSMEHDYRHVLAGRYGLLSHVPRSGVARSMPHLDLKFLSE